MIKTITGAILMTLFICSCNNAADEDKEIKEVREYEIRMNESNGSLVYLDSTENIFNILCQGWELADDVETLEGLDDNSSVEISFRSLYFSPDKTFIKNPRNAMDHGDWEYDDASKTITLNCYVEKEKSVYKIASLAYDELILVNIGINSTTNLKFISSGKRFVDMKDEPFYIANNRWRLKPARKEPDSAIHRRLKENLRFFILFYKSAIEKNDKNVSFWGLPSCYKWYGGAIYMKKKERLRDNWIDCFYNEEQAMKAYAMAEKLLEKDYKWPKGVSWLKQNLSVLEQMYKNIDEIK